MKKRRLLAKILVIVMMMTLMMQNTLPGYAKELNSSSVAAEEFTEKSDNLLSDSTELMPTIETTADGESGNSGGDTADTSTTSAPEMPDSEAADKPKTEITAGAEATGSEVVTTDEYSSVKPEDELTTTDDGNAGSETETNTQANKDVAEVQEKGEFTLFAESNEDAKDIGNLVDQSGVTLSIISGSSETKIIDNGHPVEGAPEIKVGDKLKLSYEGNISPESMEQINAGDYFTIQLPDTEYISTIEGTYDLKTEDGEVYATYTIANGALTVTLTEVGASQSEIDDGWIQITGSAIKSGDNVVISTNGNVPITINIKPGSGGSGGGGGNDAGQTEIPDGKITFTKDGKQYDGKDILNWHLNVNYDGLRQMVSGENVSQKNKVILVDTLPNEVAVDMGSIYITAPIFVPTPDGKMSGYSIGYLRVTPTVLYAEDGESYEHFYQRINTFSSLSVGVYENKILFGFGNLPGNGVTYDSNYIDSLVASHVSSGDITEAQGSRLKEVYDSEGPTEGQIVGYDVSYDTNVTGDSGDYTNIAQLLWNTDDEKDAQYTIAYNSTSGGASSRINVTVNKVWNDQENKDGLRPDQITIQLYADEEEKGEPVTVIPDADGNWSYRWMRLPKNQNGHAIEYTAKEINIPDGYTSESVKNADGSITITNTHAPETPAEDKTTVSVKKNWVGPALDSATVSLLADGEPKESIVLNPDKNWTYTFENLPKYDSTNGHEIAYTVSEEPAENYSTAITWTAADGYTITNTITGKESIPVTKKWIGPAADSVTVKLMSGDTEVASQVLNAGNHWQYTFTDVDKYDTAGNEIQYTVKEDAVNGYSSSITGNIADGFVITNYNTERISIPVTKKWVGEAVGHAEVDLKDESGNVVDSAALTKENEWKATFSDLPKYDSTDGHEIRYTLSEKPMANYNPVVTGDTATGFTVTNTITGKVSVGVTKKWIGPDAGSATVRLKDGETEIDSAVLNADNNWQHTFSDLDQFDEEGKEIDYTISEDAISGYDTSIVESTPNGFTVTNTNLEKTSVDVEKRWVGPVKDQVTVTLLSDGTEKQSAVLTAESNWKTSFTDLPKYDSADGHEISYTVSESPVDGYSSAISGTAKDGYTITNTITGKISIPVTKVWAGGTGDKAVVHLFANGNEIESLELNSSNKWQHTFENLDQYKDGEEIRYTLTEDSVSGYSTTITYSQDKGFTVTNSKNGGGNHGGGHDHDHPNNPTTPTAPGSAATQSGTIRSPQTGDNSHMVLYLLLMIGSIVALISDLIFLKEHKGATR